MADQARHVRGSNVFIDIDGGVAYLDVGCVYAMSFPGLMRGTADVTCMNDTDFYRKFIKGFKDSGEITFKTRFDPVNYPFLKSAFEDDRCNLMPRWKFVFGNCPGDDTAHFVFFAIITKLDMPEKSIDGENIWEVDVTVKISGKTSFFRNNVQVG